MTARPERQLAGGGAVTANVFEPGAVWVSGFNKSNSGSLRSSTRRHRAAADLAKFAFQFDFKRETPSSANDSYLQAQFRRMKRRRVARRRSSPLPGRFSPPAISCFATALNIMILEAGLRPTTISSESPTGLLRRLRDLGRRHRSEGGLAWPNSEFLFRSARSRPESIA